jgi:hypothetical protein
MKPINNNLIAKEWYDILISSLEIFSTPENVTVEEFEYSMKFMKYLEQDNNGDFQIELDLKPEQLLSLTVNFRRKYNSDFTII